jgi:NAD(P)-dependent dehydrogenase (short-subunit alcohol dehydrogenase family)
VSATADIVVVNAGILIRGTVDKYDLEDFDRMLATNVRGVFVAIQASASHLTDGGRIITIGSNTAIRTAFPGASVYSMTKGAIASLVRGVAIDLAPRGITVNNVQPGPIATDMTAGHVETVTLLAIADRGDLNLTADQVGQRQRLAAMAVIAGLPIPSPDRRRRTSIMRHHLPQPRWFRS